MSPEHGRNRPSVRETDTANIRVAFRESGSPSSPPFILLHGNCSSSVFFEPLMTELQPHFRTLAPDLRGFGATEALPIDARRGLRDWSDDLAAWLDALGLAEPVHLLGWSLGGGVAMQFAIDHPERVRRLILESPLSPFGFGGTVSADGQPAYSDFAGSGGGTVNPEFVTRIERGEREAVDANSPRAVMNQFYFRPPFRVEPALEERLVDGLLSTRTGPGFYPGSLRPSDNWPGVAPGDDGTANAMAAGAVNLMPLVDIEPKAPVLWIRGDSDAIVSDQSLLDFGTLGKLQAVPGWPGDARFPPQPMVSQMRYVLEHYQNHGGHYEELVVPEAGHSPHLERPDVVTPVIIRFLRGGG